MGGQLLLIEASQRSEKRIVHLVSGTIINRSSKFERFFEDQRKMQS